MLGLGLLLRFDRCNSLRNPPTLPSNCAPSDTIHALAGLAVEVDRCSHLHHPPHCASVCTLQVDTMRRVDHPNIVELSNAFLSADGKTLYVCRRALCPPFICSHLFN